MKFNKYSSKRKKRRAKSADQIYHETIKEMLTDQNIGYNAPVETYEKIIDDRMRRLKK